MKSMRSASPRPGWAVKLINRLREFAAVVVEVEPERIARHQQRGLLQPYLAARLHFVQRAS